MRKRLPKLADASEDPYDCQLLHFNVNPEVCTPEGSRGRLGLALRDIRVRLLAPCCLLLAEFRADAQRVSDLVPQHAVFRHNVAHFALAGTSGYRPIPADT